MGSREIDSPQRASLNSQARSDLRPGFHRPFATAGDAAARPAGTASVDVADHLQWAVLGFFTVLLGAELIYALEWRIQHDTPLLHYVAFLIDRHGFIPYRDVFETSMPGTMLFHLAIGKFLGYSDAAFRLVDFLYLVSLLAVTWHLMKPLSKTVAYASILIFGLLYLGYGPSMSLQRDYIGLLPLAAAALVAARTSAWTDIRTKAVVIGLLGGIAASIKPQLALGLPALFVYLCMNGPRRAPQESAGLLRRLLPHGMLGLLGFVLVLALVFAWLWKSGGLPHFWEMLSSYLPLHVQLTGDHEMITGMARLKYLFASYREFGGLSLLLIPAMLGVYIALSESDRSSHKRLVALLFSLMALYSIYPALSGQFWDYHWMPFIYFASLCAALSLSPPAGAARSLFRRVGPLLVFTMALFLLGGPSNDFVRQVTGREPHPPKTGRVDEIADYLRSTLQPGDKVQPLDWTEGALQAMLMTGTVIATPYLYDYHFYHHVSQPYIQTLRQRFLDRLAAEQPRFIIDVYAKPQPSGADTEPEFPALDDYIDAHYVAVHEGDGFTVLERTN